MSAKNAKLIRGQLRDIIKEMLPQILTQEVVKGMMTSNAAVMRVIESNVNKKLKEIEERQKNSLDYLIRQATVKKDIG